MQTIPLSAIPSQSLSVVLAQQNCQINVYQKTTGLYFDLTVNGAAIVSTVICRNVARLVRKDYTGFVGDFSFVDMQGMQDPDYTGLGSRYFLLYLEATDL